MAFDFFFCLFFALCFDINRTYFRSLYGFLLYAGRFYLRWTNAANWVDMNIIMAIFHWLLFFRLPNFALRLIWSHPRYLILWFFVFFLFSLLNFVFFRRRNPTFSWDFDWRLTFFWRFYRLSRINFFNTLSFYWSLSRFTFASNLFARLSFNFSVNRMTFDTLFDILRFCNNQITIILKIQIVLDWLLDSTFMKTLLFAIGSNRFSCRFSWFFDLNRTRNVFTLFFFIRFYLTSPI